MDGNDTLARCIALVEREVPRLQGRVTADLDFAAHDIDSLDVMAFAVEAEDVFQVLIDDSVLDTITSPRALAEAVDDALRTARPRGPSDNPALYRDADADGEAQTPEDAA
ncbi:acyl carrier protein [Pararhodobacter marinus]|uniref:acyl carrier protein n=1 Tax=Pararhodobacter marinus TaxID=2184063 RepID=UPI003518F6C4